MQWVVCMTMHLELNMRVPGIKKYYDRICLKLVAFHSGARGGGCWTPGRRQFFCFFSNLCMEKCILGGPVHGRNPFRTT